ncbi:MAG: glycine oxidase ThiO [Pirellulales bacterium]
MDRCAIIGGGVVGLSLAYELACRNWRVSLFDRQQTGREASWAGAGILPPANLAAAVHPLDQLRGLSFQLHAEWATRLREETGIDTEYRRCGALYVAQTAGEAASLAGFASLLREERIDVERLETSQLATCEPSLAAAVDAGLIRTAYWLPEEAQLRNPRHLAALREACLRRGVEIHENQLVERLATSGDRCQGLVAAGKRCEVDRVCVAAGAWSTSLLAACGVTIGVLPIRGQMALWHAPVGALHHIVNEGPRYLVPRLDGRILAGSTEEEAGFDKRTTDEGIAGLVEFACRYVPLLRSIPLERTWAGLRPGVYDGLPYLGEIPTLKNVFVAAGHFRSGLYLSPGTAVALAALIADERSPIDVTPFRVSRG